MGWSLSDMPSLVGKHAVVTGATGGLGLAVAKALAAKGANVVLTGRRRDAGEAAAAEIGANARFLPLDLSSLVSVRDLASQLSDHPAIDLLVNNAGIALVPKAMRSPDGFELQMATNHLGHVLLTSLLLPALANSGNGRVVTLCSMAARNVGIAPDDLFSERDYTAFNGYARSKLAAFLFAMELDRLCRASGIAVRGLSTHPGVAVSNLQEAGPRIGNPSGTLPLALKLSDFVTRHFGGSTADGALAILCAATDPDAQGGSYFGPGGFGGIKGPPRQVPFPRNGANRRLAAQIWLRSNELTGALWPMLQSQPS